MKVFILYLLLVNLLAYIMFNLDKWYARTGGWRISERSLFAACLVGGSIGGYLGMRLAHHKTLKSSFSFGIPLLMCLQILLILCIVR